MASAAAASSPETLDLDSLARDYSAGTRSATAVLAAVRARIEARGDDGVWTALTSAEQMTAALASLEARRHAGEALPLYGVPFGVKDNIDVAGLPTTAACPAFTYTPSASAAAVERLIAAGAIVVGKTNLDQFATGLVGVRSPYGVPRNPFNDRYITGGSSSGSAVAVAVGEVTFSLGTDTAGSGRVPASFNNIVGLKPSRGVISTRGVVPACRSLDCVSVFAATVEDAARVAEVARGFDAADPYSNPRAAANAFLPAEATPSRFRFGVPRSSQRIFHGDTAAAAAYAQAIDVWTGLGGAPVEIDMAPFFEAGTLLYEGAFVAERLEAAGELYARDPAALVAPLRAILNGALRHDARAAFAAQSKLRLLRRRIEPLWQSIDFLMLPTAPTLPTLAAVELEPLKVNFDVGLYTTFGNLLNLSALAVPAGFRADGLPFGVSLLRPWGDDARIAGFGARFHRATSTRIGATDWPLPPPTEPRVPIAGPASDEVELAVVGAHLAGQPLNHQLTALGGRLLRAGKTVPRYRLFALPNTTPAKPGLVHVSPDSSGAEIAVEVWALPTAGFGAFVAGIPAPLCIGKLQLGDGSVVAGFLCESHAVAGARDISSFGGWRAYLGAGA